MPEPEPAPKRRKLNNMKCAQCRIDKKGCIPNNRDWPRQKCGWCIEQELPCGPSELPPRYRKAKTAGNERQGGGCGLASRSSMSQVPGHPLPLSVTTAQQAHKSSAEADSGSERKSGPTTRLSSLVDALVRTIEWALYAPSWGFQLLQSIVDSKDDNVEVNTALLICGEEIVEALLEYGGADVERLVECLILRLSGTSPREGTKPIMHQFISKGYIWIGRTALQFLLEERKKAPDHTYQHYRTSIHTHSGDRSEFGGLQDIMNGFQHSTRSVRTIDSYLFRVAIEYQEWEDAESILLEEEIDPNFEDALFGETALHKLADADDEAHGSPGPLSLGKILLERSDIDFNEKGDCETPLMLAFSRGFLEFAKLLLQRRDVNVNDVDGLGFTVLMHAIGYDYPEMLELLLQRKEIDLNIADRWGRTALHYAAFRLSNRHDENHRKCICLLLQHPKTDIHGKDKDGKTAATLAADQNNGLFIELWNEHLATLLSAKEDQPPPFPDFSLPSVYEPMEPIDPLISQDDWDPYTR